MNTLPQNSVDAYGIDVGKSAIHICKATPHKSLKAWDVTVVSFKDHPTWWVDVLNIIPENALVCLEPTGYHYTRPLLNVLAMRPTMPTVWMVSGATTAGIRSSLISRAKNDHIDARAIAFIAQELAKGNEIRGCKPFEFAMREAVEPLRHFINARRRAVKLSVRSLNQLDALIHGIFPELAIRKETYIKGLAWGACTPEQLHALAQKKPEGMHTNLWKSLCQLADTIPPIDVPSTVVDVINTVYEEYAHAQASIEALDEKISRQLEKPEFQGVIARWRTVRSMSEHAIACFLVATDGIPHLLDRNSFVACLGANPRTGVSGSIDKTRPPRGGYLPARDSLFLLVQRLLSPVNAPNVIYDYHHKAKKSASACRRKMAVQLWAIAHFEDGAWQGKQAIEKKPTKKKGGSDA